MSKRGRRSKANPVFRLNGEMLENRRLLAGDFLLSLANEGAEVQASVEFGYSTDSDGGAVVVGAPSTDANGFASVGEAYVFDEVTGDLIATLENPSPSSGDRFGHAVAVAENFVVVGDPRHDDEATDSGTVFVFDRATGALVRELSNPESGAFDFFGSAVAADGDTIVVGAFLDNASVTDSGSVHVFDASTGELRHSISRASAEPLDSFGFSVDIENDLLVVGSPRADMQSRDDGAVYLYDAVTGTLQAEFTNPNPDDFDFYGQSVAISGDRIVVSAHRDDLGQVSAGAAYVYEVQSGNTAHTLIHTLINPTPQLSDNFGIDIDIDGDQILIGAYRDDTGARDAGAAYQYDAVSGDLVFTYTNPTPDVIDYFGFSVAVSSTSSTVGAYWDDAAALDSGMLYQFDPGTGSSIRDLATPAASSFDYFGQAVATSGEFFVVSAPLDDAAGTDSGVIYVHDSDGALQQTILNPDPGSFDQFGATLSISGSILAAGAFNNDTGGIANSGVVYLFDMTDGSLLHTLNSPNPSANGRFGTSVSIDGLQVIVGAPNEDIGATDSGAAYIFDVSSGQLVSQVENPAAGAFDQFGTSVAIADNTVAVGALADVSGVAKAGIGYVLDVPTGDLVATLNNPAPQANDNFGQSIALRGNRVLVGAPRKDLGQIDAGAAYLFNAISGATVAEIENPQANAGSFFGYSLALSADFAGVGAFGSAGIGTQFPQAGAAYLFQSTTGAFHRDLLPPQAQIGDLFGLAVAASESDFLVGAPQIDGLNTDRGAAFLFDGHQAAPPIADAGGPYTVDEGSLLQLDGSASSDPNQPADSLIYHWDLDYNGSTFDLDAEGVSPEVLSADDASVTIALRVTDSDGLESIATTTLVVNNVAPTIESDAATLTVTEGELATLTGSFSDPGDDIVTISATLGTLVDNGDGTWAWEFQTADGPDESVTVTVAAQDEDGGMSEAAFDLIVENVAPEVTGDFASVTVLAGQTAQNSGTLADLGDDEITLSASVGAIVDNGDGTWSWSLDTTTSDVSGTVQIDAADSDGATSSFTFDLVVDLLNVDLALVNVSEGDLAANSGFYAPPVADETVTLSASVGDVVDNGDGTWSWSFDSLDGPDDSQVVTITADYSNGGQGAVDFDLTTENVAPTVTVDMPTVLATEGETATNTGTFADVGMDVVTLSATLGVVVDNGDGTWTWTLGTVNGMADVQVVEITAQDEDNATTMVSFDLDAANVAPTVTADVADVTVNEGDVAANGGTYADVDAVTLTASVGEVVDNGDGTWSWTFDSLDGPEDTQVVTITAEDDDGATGVATFNLTVENAPPVLTVDNVVVQAAVGGVGVNFGTFGDPGDDDVTLSASVGEVVDNGDGTWSWLFSDVTTDDNQTVEITATDSDGAEAAVTFELQVALLASASGTINFEEGQTASNSGNYSLPPNGETVSLSASLGDVVDNGDGSWSWSLTDLDGPSSLLVTITADYSTGESATTEFTLDVFNALPELTVQSQTVIVGKYPFVRNFGTVSDAAWDTVTLSVSVGTIVHHEDGTWTWRYRPLNRIDGAQEIVTVTAEDDDGGVVTLDFTLLTVLPLTPKTDGFDPAIQSVSGALVTNPSSRLNAELSSYGGSQDVERDDDQPGSSHIRDSIFANTSRWYL